MTGSKYTFFVGREPGWFRVERVESGGWLFVASYTSNADDFFAHSVYMVVSR